MRSPCRKVFFSNHSTARRREPGFLMTTDTLHAGTHSTVARAGATGASAPAHRRSHHYPELDALRGVAALVVVLVHFGRLWDTPELTHTWQRVLAALFLPGGTAAVIVFFLLSGFVLSLPYKRHNELPYGVFVLRRIARIYLPYLAALALALLGFWRLGGPLPVSAWFNETWTAPLTGRLILDNALLIGNYDTAQVNTAFWSLAVEMRLSLIFPLLCLPFLRWRHQLAFALAAIVVLIEMATPHLFAHRLDAVSFSNLTDTTLGLLCFVAGILLARTLEPLQQLWAGLTRWQRRIFFLISIGLLQFGGNLGLFHVVGVFAGALQVAGGCGVLISVLFSHEISKTLNRKLPALLGRISYSLYLVHGTVLFALVHLFFGRLTRPQLFAPYLISAIAVAAIFFVLVEKPSIALSRSIGPRKQPLSNPPSAPQAAPGAVS
jgi:peptidoglycan/LPS O-acetylase OafA/YrhL